MVENQEKQANSILKSGKLSPNKIFIVLNLLLLSIFIFQTFQIIKTYSDKTKKDTSEGRKVIINAKNNEVESLKLSEEEINLINPDYKKAQQKQATTAIEVSEEIIGPQLLSEEQIKANYATANLAIIVTDIGKTNTGLGIVSKLPKEISFAFSPYSDDLQNKIKRTAADGRQVLLNLILEPSGFPLKDSGPLTILTSLDKNQNQRRFDKSISDYTGYIGYLTNFGEVFTNNLEVATPTLNRIKDEKKFFGYYRNAANAYLENDVKPMAVDIFIVDYLIDEDVSEKQILKKLEQAKSDIISKKRRVVIALRPYKISVEILQEWLKKNLSANIRIAPISYFITDN